MGKVSNPESPWRFQNKKDKENHRYLSFGHVSVGNLAKCWLERTTSRSYARLEQKALPKTPENRPSQEENSLPTTIFQGLC